MLYRGAGKGALEVKNAAQVLAGFRLVIFSEIQNPIPLPLQVGKILMKQPMISLPADAALWTAGWVAPKARCIVLQEDLAGIRIGTQAVRGNDPQLWVASVGKISLRLALEKAGRKRIQPLRSDRCLEDSHQCSRIFGNFIPEARLLGAPDFLPAFGVIVRPPLSGRFSQIDD